MHYIQEKTLETSTLSQFTACGAVSRHLCTWHDEKGNVFGSHLLLIILKTTQLYARKEFSNHCAVSIQCIECCISTSMYVVRWDTCDIVQVKRFHLKCSMLLLLLLLLLYSFLFLLRISIKRERGTWKQTICNNNNYKILALKSHFLERALYKISIHYLDATKRSMEHT